MNCSGSLHEGSIIGVANCESMDDIECMCVSTVLALAHCKLAIEKSMTSADILPDASRLPDKVF
jgi:hypothetical protein